MLMQNWFDECNGVDKEESRHFTVSSYEEAELLATERVLYEYSWDWIYVYIGFENNWDMG